MDDIKAERMKVVELTAENRKLTDQVRLCIVSLHGVPGVGGNSSLGMTGTCHPTFKGKTHV